MQTKYKLVKPLKIRHVEPWAEYVFTEKIQEHSQPMSSALALRKAVECGWFDGEQPDVDDLEIPELLKLAQMMFSAYAEAMKIDEKN